MAVLAAGLVGSVLLFGKNYKHDNGPIIIDFKKHNGAMNAFMKTVLAKHPGAIVETEDGRPIYDIDIQGADGKNWEIECDAELATVIEDNVDKD